MNTVASSNNFSAMLKNSYPWIVWFLGASFFFYKYALQVSPSVMSGDLMREFSIAGAGLGNLAACFFYTYMVMQIPVGILLDRYSPRLIISLAIFVCAIGTLMFSQAHSLGMAIISRGLIGLGAAFAAVSCLKLITLWFPPQRFALIAGLSMTAAMLGAVGGEAPLSFMVKELGWREALVYCAFFGFVLAALVALMVRDKTSLHHSVSSVTTDDTTIFEKLKIIMKCRQTWLLSWYSGLAFAPISVFGGLWGVPFLEQAYQLSSTMAASAVSWIFIGFAVGCPISGWFSDHIGRRVIIMMYGTIVALITMTLVLYLPSASALTLDILLFCFGLGASCFFLCFSMIREIHRLIFAATVLGFMNTFDSVCEALSEPFVGKLLDMGWAGQIVNGVHVFSTHDYRLALMVLPIFFFIALILLLFIKETHCQQKY